MKVVGKTDVGLVRSSNQDAFYAVALSEHAAWAVVCDGMGGANGGNIASKTAVEEIKEQITASFQENMNPVSIKNLLTAAIYNANVTVFDYAAAHAELSGMGTTIVLAIIDNGVLHIAHAGDSRAYLITAGSITQITTDHSVVQKMVESGEITEEQAKSHPRKNIITRALGVASYIDVDYSQMPFQEDDILLLCTDGLSNCVEPETIRQLATELTIDCMADKLISLAKEAGGRDNITVVIIGK